MGKTNVTRYNGKLLSYAKELRKEMTPEERLLWNCFLRKHPLHWYKQRTIENYIVDFYCASAKLIIELDGSQHYTEEGMEYDAQRTEVLEGLGFRVIRFSNYDVKSNFYGVCAEIDRVVNLSCHCD